MRDQSGERSLPPYSRFTNNSRTTSTLKISAAFLANKEFVFTFTKCYGIGKFTFIKE
ncbi:MAG: hypothetical protein ACTS7E_01760 [Arsenophonus sp. NC-CH8-MAG3]